MKSIVNNILRVLAILISVIFLIFLLKLNILPMLYLIIVIVLVVGLNVLGWFLLSSKGVKLIIGYIIVAITIILSSAGVYYTFTTNSFFESIEEAHEKEIYYVVVTKSSGYKKMDDLDKKTMAIFENNSKTYQKALKEVKKETSITDKKYENINEIVKDLLEGKVDSLLINSNNKEILDENIVSFKDNTKVIKKISIDVIKKNEASYKNKYGPFNILISGIDTNGNIERVSRSDVNIVVTVNPNTHDVLLTSIPRDMQVQLHGTTGLKDKLTHAGIYGIDMSRQTIEDFLDIEIPYYIRVNFDSVVKLVDTIGGVDIYNDVAFKGGTRYFDKGNLHLNGKEALEYARERKKMPEGDFTRGLHQEEIIKAIITKVSTSKELLTDYDDILNGLKDFIQTNIPDSTIKKYIRDQLKGMPAWTVNNSAVAGSGSGYESTYSIPGMNLYVTYPDEEKKQAANKQINEILKKKDNE